MAISQAYINESIGKLEILHGRMGNEFCNILKRHTGDRLMYDEISSAVNLCGWIIDILYDYRPVGIKEINELNNTLTEAEINAMINYGYRIMNKYGHEIFTPTNPNVYL